MNKWQLISLERPSGLVGEPWWCKDMTYMLPREAREKRMVMLDMTYLMPALESKDPIIIFSRDGRILRAWPDGYIPGPFEIERVGKLLAKQSVNTMQGEVCPS